MTFLLLFVSSIDQKTHSCPLMLVQQWIEHVKDRTLLRKFLALFLLITSSILYFLSLTLLVLNLSLLVSSFWCVLLMWKSSEASALFNMATSSSSSFAAASMSPGNSSGHDQKDELLFSDDPNFALHGEIMMLIFVLLFIIFLFVLLFSLYMKKLYNGGDHSTEHCSLEQVFPRNLPVVQFQDHLETGSKLQHQSVWDIKVSDYADR